MEYEDFKSDFDKLTFASEVMSVYQEQLFEEIKSKKLNATEFNEYIREIIEAHEVETYLNKLADEAKTKSELAKLASEVNK